MSRFVLGDELGNIKALKYDPSRPEGSRTDLQVLHQHEQSASACSVQKLSVLKSEDQLIVSSPNHTRLNAISSLLFQEKLAAAFSDGHCTLSDLDLDKTLSTQATWKETRMSGSKFVGLALSENAFLSCTANGMLRRTTFSTGNSIQASESATAILPSRLFEWRLSSSTNTFAYGGDEVDLSVWDIERVFHRNHTEEADTTTTSASKKRKRKDDLFPAEVWRARNLPNDHLNLRPPVRISALTYLDSTSGGHHLLTGTQFGDIRRYDTRAGRRPVSNWTGLGKVGGVTVVEKGFSEHELFMGDGGANLCSIDLRTGGILHGYKGVSGGVTSIAPSESAMVSVGLDRFARINSVVAPPLKAGTNQEQKAAVLEKCYLASTPTAIVWDHRPAPTSNKEGQNEEEDDEVWDKLENIS